MFLHLSDRRRRTRTERDRQAEAIALEGEADFRDGCREAIDWVLPDLTLISPDAAEQLQRLVYGGEVVA